MEGAWFHPQQNFQSSGWRRRKRAYRVGGGASSRSIAAPVLKSGYGNLNQQRNYLNVESDSTSSSDYQRENSSSSYKQTSGGLTSVQMDENMSKSEEIRHSSPSIIEKLMALHDLHTPGLVPKKQMAMQWGGSQKIGKDSTKPINMVSDLHEIKWLRSPRHGRCITNLKSSGVIEHQTSDIHHRYERTTKRKDKINSARKRTSCLFSNSLEECTNFSLARLRYAGKNNPYTHPGKIVSLNRNLKKDDKMRSSPLFPEQAHNALLSNRIQSRSKFLESLSKGRYQKNFSSNAKDVAKMRDSREVDRNVKNLVKQSYHVDSKIRSDREEHKLSPKELLVSPEELCKKSSGKPSEHNLPNSSVAAVADSGILDDMFSVSSCTDVNMILVSNRDLAKEVTADVFSTQNEAQPPSSNIKQDAQLSPTYVHEFPSMEEDTSERCLQLQIAKSNSGNACGDFSEVLKILNDNSLQSLQQNKDVEFSDEEARDFSYLLDILFESGYCATKKRRILDASYMPECGIGTDVFEKLEKKYSKLALWSRSERKLFFDLLNSILVEIIAPNKYLFPRVNSSRKVGPMLCFQGLAEKAWQILSIKCKEFHVSNAEQKVMDEKWLDLGDDIDEIEEEIGRMLHEELLEELVSDFYL